MRYFLFCVCIEPSCQASKLKYCCNITPASCYDYASTRRHPEIARVIVLLSLKAGMRAGEIANLTLGHDHHAQWRYQLGNRAS